MGGVLQYKWEAYCDTNGGVLTVFPFTQTVGAPEALRYKLEAYCNTNGSRIAILFREVVVVGVSDILLRKVGEGLARRVGAQGWRRVGRFPCTLQFRNSRRTRLKDRVCDSMV